MRAPLGTGGSRKLSYIKVVEIYFLYMMLAPQKTGGSNRQLISIREIPTPPVYSIGDRRGSRGESM